MIKYFIWLILITACIHKASFSFTNLLGKFTRLQGFSLSEEFFSQNLIESFENIQNKYFCWAKCLSFSKCKMVLFEDGSCSLLSRKGEPIANLTNTQSFYQKQINSGNFDKIKVSYQKINLFDFLN